MSIKLSEILPPADKLFDRKELEQIFLEAVRLTKEVEEETSLGFTSVKVNNYFFQAYQDENEYLLSLGSQKKETDMVKNITVHFSEISSKQVTSKHIETSVTFTNEIPVIKNFNFEGAA